jgi:hypothetical protein
MPHRGVDCSNPIASESVLGPMRVMIDDVNVSLSDRPADSPELMEGEETRPRQLCNS